MPELDQRRSRRHGGRGQGGVVEVVDKVQSQCRPDGASAAGRDPPPRVGERNVSFSKGTTWFLFRFEYIGKWQHMHISSGIKVFGLIADFTFEWLLEGNFSQLK